MLSFLITHSPVPAMFRSSRKVFDGHLPSPHQPGGGRRMRYGLIALFAMAVAFNMLSSTVSATRPIGASASIEFSTTSLWLDSGSSETAVTIGSEERRG